MDADNRGGIERERKHDAILALGQSMVCGGWKYFVALPPAGLKALGSGEGLFRDAPRRDDPATDEPAGSQSAIVEEDTQI